MYPLCCVSKVLLLPSVPLSLHPDAFSTDVEAGGETSFPAADPEGAKFKMGDGADVSNCARGKVAVRPRKGDALLFWNLKPDSTLDAKSLHGKLHLLTTAVVGFHSPRVRTLGATDQASTG